MGGCSWKVKRTNSTVILAIFIKKNKTLLSRMMMKMKTETCRSTTWTPVRMMMTSQLRKRAAAQALPVPARPRAPPAPVLGRGPGKRVQVKGNSGQNVSISSIFLLVY